MCCAAQRPRMSVFTCLIWERQQTQARSSGLQVAGEGYDLETILL